MNNIWTIAKREYDNYFSSPLAYVIGFVILLILGVYFSAIMFFSSGQALYGGPAPTNEQITWWFSFLLTISIPILTMRLISDEARMGTLELMLTAPVRDIELVVGKWLGAFLYVLTLTAVTLVYPIIMDNFISPGLDWRVVLSSYLGLMLFASTLIALGVGISAIFTNQFAAFFITFGLFIFLTFFIGIPASLLQKGGEIFDYLSFSTHFFNSMNRGTINLGDIVYFLSLTALGLFTGSTAIEIRRWR